MTELIIDVRKEYGWPKAEWAHCAQHTWIDITTVLDHEEVKQCEVCGAEKGGRNRPPQRKHRHQWLWHSMDEQEATFFCMLCEAICDIPRKERT